MKRCTKCKISKDESCFTRDRYTKDELHPECKVCCRARRQHTYYFEGGQEKRRAAGLRYNSGLTIAQFNQMLADQKGVCAICKKPDKNSRRFHVDHCHKTGKIRGLLCDACNLSLGRMENKNFLEKALAYLKKNG